MENLVNHLESKLDVFIKRHNLDVGEVHTRPSSKESQFKHVSIIDLVDLYGDKVEISTEVGQQSEIYMVSMLELKSNTSKKIRHTAYFLSERSAAQDVDITFIKHGREPINVLKRK